MENVDNALSLMLTRQKEAKEESKALKAQVLKALKKHKITDVTCSYSGGGDSGQVDMVTLYRGDKTVQKLPKTSRIEMVKERSEFDDKLKKWVRTKYTETVDIEEAIRELTYSALESRFPGWEINDGSDGDLKIDIKEGTVRMEHRTHVSEYEEVEI